MPRLFIGIPIPEKIRKKIVSQYTQTIADQYPFLIITHPQKLHITILFMGEVPTKKEKTIIQKFKKMSLPKATPVILGEANKPIQAFNQNVLYLKAKDEEKFLEKINQKCRQLFPNAEHNSFTPHITIARNKHRDPITPIIQKLNQKPFEEKFTPDHITLFESIQLTGETHYKTIATRKIMEKEQKQL